MTVQHQVGRLEIKGDQLVNSMSGTRGLFRKEPWERLEVIPIGELTEVRVLEQIDGSINLSISRHTVDDHPYRKPSDVQDLAQGFLRCGPPDAIERFLEGLHEVNPAMSIEWGKISDDLAAMPAIRVKTYRSSDEFEKDAPRMAAAGWIPEDQTALSGHVNLRRTTARVLLGGFLLGGASRSKDRIIVTWVRGQGSPSKSVPNASGEAASPGHEEQNENVPLKLRQLAQLRDSGIISEGDFEAKKAELLGRM